MRITNHFLRSKPLFTVLVNLLLVACSAENANEVNSNSSDLSVINVSNASVKEGDSGTSELVFRVSLNAISSNDISVGYSTTNGLADSGSDFEFSQATLLINAGSLTNTVRININGDIEPEQHETMTLTLSNPSGATLGNTVATGTIIDDDVRVLNVANARALEGDSGSSILRFDIRLDKTATTDVSVDYASKDGKATTLNNDYVATNGTLIIAVGSRSGTIEVTINGDLDTENDENFTLDLNNVSNNAVLARASANAIIVGDDRLLANIGLPKTGQKNCFDSKGDFVPCAGTGQDGDQQQGVNWPEPRFSQNGNGTVTDNLTNLVWPLDWNTSAAQLVTWQAALDHVKSLNAVSHLGFNDWRLPNRNELKSLLNFGVTENRKWLTDPTQGFQNITAKAYWTSSTYKHEIGVTEFAWTIVMNENAHLIGSANKSNTTGMAAVPVRGGSDYALAPVAKTGQVLCYDTLGQLISCTGTGQDGELQLGYFWQTPRFTDNGDGSVTDNTTRYTWTANPIGSGLTWQQALDEISIINAQSYLGYSDWRMPNVNEIDSLINSGLATVAWLERFGFGSLQNINVWTSTTNRCVKPISCLPTEARLFATSTNPWQKLLKLTANTQNYLWPVRDNNTAQNLPELDVADVSVIEGNSGNTQLIFTVSLSAKTQVDVQVNYSVSDVSATVNEDYLATAGGTLSIFAGSISNTITLSIVGDTVIEPNEKLLLTLSSPSGATLGKSNAIATIVDDEVMTPINLPQTGQRNCFDTDANVIPCAGTGQDGELQPGIAWPKPRFVANNNSTIVDKLTGLIWLANANLMVTRDPNYDLDKTLNDGLVSWRAALDYIAKLNTELYLGFNDWRLPNRSELNSLVDFARPNRASFLQNPSTGFNEIISKGYWTSTRDTFNTQFTWYISVVTGFEGLGPYRAVLPVRGGQSNTATAPAALAKTGQTQCYDGVNVINCIGTGQDGELQVGIAWPTLRFTNNNDGTVKDNLTGLMWAADGNIMPTRDAGYDSDGLDNGAVTWQQALDYVGKLNAESYLGYNDWRLPNVIEGQSRFLNQGLVRNWLISNGFSNVDFAYWTSSTHFETASHAWKFDKFERERAFKTESFYVWPVRGGL